MKKVNFCAGPSILPESVFSQLSDSVKEYEQTGLSILEISHRSEHYRLINEGAIALVKELLCLSDDYEVLFLTGGASTQFCLVPYNLLPSDGIAAYLNTGQWSKKAMKEAQLFGQTEEVASSAADNFAYIPKGYKLNRDYTYLHITTNNTVCGTQIHELPDVSCPLVADMSSDILSKKVDMSKFGLVYAGAQKNLGPVGVTVVIVRKDLLGKANRQIPTMLDYRTHIKSNSVFNTPPVFSIYGCYLNLQWIKEKGLAWIEQNNRAKAALLYGEIERNGLFKGITAKEDRSIMNATFTTVQPDLESRFLKMAEAAGCVALKGHRSFGGFRASMYNAMEVLAVQVLVDVMQEFERKFG